MGIIIPYSHIHRMSVHDTARTKPSGIPQASIVGTGNKMRLRLNTIHWMGRSYDCDPRQIGLMLSHGNHQNADVTAVGIPKIFWQTLPENRRPKDLDEPGWVMGRFKGKPGQPEGPIEWTYIPDNKVPSLADGILAKASSNVGTVLGGERCMENIISCKPDPKKPLNVIVTHASENSDRWSIIINPDGWDSKGARFYGREFLDKSPDKKLKSRVKSRLSQAVKLRAKKKIRALCSAINTDNYEIEFKTKDNKTKRLNELLQTANFYDLWLAKGKIISPSREIRMSIQELVEETKDYRDTPFADLTDSQKISIMHLNRLVLKATYSDLCPKSEELQRRVLIETLQRIDITDIKSYELSKDGKTLYLESEVLVIDENNTPLHHKVDISCLKINPNKTYQNPEDRKFSVEITVPDENIDFECRKREHVHTFFNRAPVDTSLAVVKAHRDEENRYVVSIEPKEPGKPKVEISASGNTVWQRREIKNDPAYKAQPKEIRDAILEALDLVLDVDNLEWSRVTKARHRYELKFYRYRESTFKGVLDKALEPGESVVLTKVMGAAEVVHLNDHNGQERGKVEIIPINFDPFFGNKAHADMVRLDPRPDALRKTRFVDPVATAIAGQHLRDPYVMGVENMSNIWPKIDQLGFFGIFMMAAMAFPHGNMFTDPSKNPWFVRWFGTTSHSIFDAKSDAGTRYHWLTGNPILDKMVTGAAMITGPNTDTVNPVREGRLFHSRIPGMKPHMIKTAIPGYYIIVIEDAWSSYLETTELGLVTETTIFPFSGGGGLNNYQLALKTQRGQRWDAGRAIYTLDTAKEFAVDLFRGNRVYQFLWNAKTNLFLPYNIEGRADLANTARKDTLSRVQPTSPKMTARVARAFNTSRAVAKKYLLNEFREWFNVGHWYWVSLRQTAFYLIATSMVVLGMSALPAQGALFLLACIGATLFAWPLWAIQMMKVGVSPKGIMSFSPRHIFWSDLAMHTQIKSGLDIERMANGKFRISDNSLGNAITAKDKRYAFWVAAVLPIFFGSVLFASALGVGLAFGLLPVIYTAAPFLLGWALASRASNWVKRALPNQNSRSFLRAFARWIAGSLFFSAGLVGSFVAFGSIAVFTIPLALALIAAFWAVFMGWNIRGAFKIYFKEQRLTYTLDTPNVPHKLLAKEKADTFRNSFRESLGRGTPLYLPDEFTRHDDPYSRFIQNEFKDLSDISALCQEIDADAYGITHTTPPNTLERLDEIIQTPNFYDLWVATKNINLNNLHPEIKRLAKETEHCRDKDFAELTFFDQERVKQLNRAIIEEEYPNHAPKRPERKDPYELWDLINARVDDLQKQVRTAVPKVLKKIDDNPLVNLNNLIGGESGVMIDLHHELRDRPSLREVIRFQLRNASGWKLLYPLEVYVALRRRLSIFLLARKTKKVRDHLQSLDRDKRKASLLEPEDYDRIRELNRLTIEEQFTSHSPEKWFAFPILRDLAEVLKKLRRKK